MSATITKKRDIRYLFRIVASVRMRCVMFEYLPPGLRTELESARMDAMRRKSRLRIRMGDQTLSLIHI